MTGKILITGPGMSGTTYLWFLMRELGFTTEPPGVETPTYELLRNKRLVKQIVAGKYEWPQVIKHLGGFLLNLHDHIDQYGWEVEHIFMVLRKLDHSVEQRAESGRKMSHKSLQLPYADYLKMSEEDKKDRMREVLRRGVGSGIYNIIERDYPLTIIRYPRVAVSADYAWEKLYEPLELKWEEFYAAWERARRQGAGISPRHYKEEGLVPDERIKKWWKYNGVQ